MLKCYPTLVIWSGTSDAAHDARPLQDVLQNDCGIKLPDWRLAAATGISDDGKTIVGYGYRLPDGSVQAFRVTLPEPGGLLAPHVRHSDLLPAPPPHTR